MYKNSLVYSSIQKLFERHNTKIRFLLVGLWNTVFGYLIFVLLDTFFENIFEKRYYAYMSAMIVGQVIATLNAFFFHKYYTFKSVEKGKGLFIEFLRFCMTYIVTFLLSLALLPFFVEIFNINPKIAAIFVILVCTIISYVGHSKFSFKK